MLRISIEKKTLHFKQPAGTSRGVYTERDIWLLTMYDTCSPENVGVGECSPLPDLSCDASENYEMRLREICKVVEQTGRIDGSLLSPYPSMLFGLETAYLNMKNGRYLFDTPFSHGRCGIPINGLVWMGTAEEMNLRMEEKI